MASDAADLVPRVLGVDRVHVLRPAGVAAQAARVNFFRRSFLEEEKFRSIGGVRDVARRSAVAIFAAVLGDAAFFVRLLPVRTFLPASVYVRMTRLAGRKVRTGSRRTK